MADSRSVNLNVAWVNAALSVTLAGSLSLKPSSGWPLKGGPRRPETGQEIQADVAAVEAEALVVEQARRPVEPVVEGLAGQVEFLGELVMIDQVVGPGEAHG